MAAELRVLPHGRHDPAARRQAQRKSRERGCWVYLSAEALVRAGIDPSGPAPFYRTWSGRRGRFVVTLYGEQ